MGYNFEKSKFSEEYKEGWLDAISTIIWNCEMRADSCKFNDDEVGETMWNKLREYIKSFENVVKEN